MSDSVKEKKEKKLSSTYNNPLGNLTMEELKEFSKKPFDELYNFIAKFKVTQSKCPPKKVYKYPCFMCGKCWANAIGKEFYDKVYGKLDKKMAKSKEKDLSDD